MERIMSILSSASLTLMAVVLMCSAAVSAPVDFSSLPGTVATANDIFNSTYSAEKAIDGIYTSNWSASTFARPANPFVLTVKLNSLYEINEIDLFSRDVSYYSDYYYIGYNMYVGVGSNMSKFVAANQTLVDSPSGYFDKFTFSAIMADTIRFEVTGGTHWAHLYEMDVFGPEQQPTATPEPGTMLLMGVGVAGAAFVRRRNAKAGC